MRSWTRHGAKSAPQTFTLTVNAVNDAPRDISLSKETVAENAAAGTEVGKLSATDPDGGTLTYTLLDNAGGRFVIDANRHPQGRECTMPRLTSRPRRTRSRSR